MARLRLLICFEILIVATLCQGSTTTPYPPDQYNTCFACIMSNYRYCAVQKKCIAINAQCNVDETQYTRGDGCPVTKKCDIGVDGNFFLDTGLQIQGGLDTSKDNEIRFKNMTIDIVRANPNNFPCAMVLFNIPKKELNFQISGPNVGVQIMKVNYPNRVTKDSLNPFNPTS